MPVTSRGVLLAVAAAVVGSVLGTSDAAARPPQPCAADYNSTNPCCGQDPHEKNPVPVAYRCPASSPVCRCYIYGTHFGFCAKAASKSTPCPAPPPPPAPATPPPPPCQSSGKAVDVEWLSCRSEQIIKGCVESILPTSPLNKGVNGKPACAACRRAPPHSFVQRTGAFQLHVALCSYIRVHAGRDAFIRRPVDKRFPIHRFGGVRTHGRSIGKGECPLHVCWYASRRLHAGPRPD